jgi:prepilin peptidase CpaA
MVFSHFVLMLLTGVLVLSGFVAVSDYRFRRIPNQYLLIASIYALAIYISMFFFFSPAQVLRGFLMSFLGFVIGGLVLYPPYRLKQVGAGDVKLMMVLGLFMGPKGIIFTLLIGAILGGIWALGLAWRFGGIKHMWYNLKFMAKSAYLTGFQEMGWDLKSEKAIKMPYGVALCGGAVLVAIEQMHLHYHKLLAFYQSVQ